MLIHYFIDILDIGQVAAIFSRLHNFKALTVLVKA
jgi:hypothetical protein